MPTINDVQQASDDFLQSAATVAVDGQEGISLATDDTSEIGSALTTDSTDVDLNAIDDSDNVILTGDSDIGVTGDGADNVVVGNTGSNVIDAGAGDDQVEAGAGDDIVTAGGGNDNIALGEGDDTAIITGGNDTVNGGAGNDTFVIDPTNPTEEPVNARLTGLNIGDRATVTVTDANGDGQLTFDDVTVTSGVGGVSFELADGTVFTLDGVSVPEASNGAISYDITDNGDGTFDVVLRSSFEDDA